MPTQTDNLLPTGDVAGVDDEIAALKRRLEDLRVEIDALENELRELRQLIFDYLAAERDGVLMIARFTEKRVLGKEQAP